MTTLTIYDNITVVEEGIQRVMEQSSLKDHYQGINMGGILVKLLTKYLGWQSLPAKYDIIMQMYLEVFIEKFHKLENSFDPEKSSLFSYLYVVMRNKIIDIGTRSTRKSDIFKKINPIEEESSDEAWDRVTIGTDTTNSPIRSTMLSLDEEEEFDSLIADYEHLKFRIAQEELIVKDINQSLENINLKIEKIEQDRLFLIEGQASNKKVLKIDTSMYESFNASSEDELDFNNQEIIIRVKDKLKAIKRMCRGKESTFWDEDKLKFLDMLLADFNFSECAIFFEVTPTSTAKWAKQIQEAFFEVADELEEEGDDSVVIALNNWLDDLEANYQHNKAKPSGCPLSKDKVELYRQIIQTFGVEFTELKGD